MNTLSYSIVRSVCTIAIGALLIAWPETAVIYLVITIGILFMLPGIFYLITAVRLPKGATLGFPVSQIGSALIGLWIVLQPTFFAGFFMYMLGILLLLLGIGLLSNAYLTYKAGGLPLGFCLIPALIVMVAMVILFNPFTASTIPFILIGVSSIVYGISNLITQLKYRSSHKEPEVTEITDADIIEAEIIEEEPASVKPEE